MVTFKYEKTPPNNHDKLEEDIRTMYKNIFDKYPNNETTFTWNGDKWKISTDIEVALFAFHKPEENNSDSVTQ